MPMLSIRLPRHPSSVVACLALACLLAACGKDAGPERTRGDAGAIPVTTTVLRERPWHDVIRALGTAKAHESVTVTAKVSETVQQVHFDSGDEVRAGAPLVTLSGQQQNAALAAAEATAAEADRMYKRQAELVAQQLIARSTVDAQRATRDAARAQVAQIRANLSDRVIRAPFAGVLGIRLVSPGALITPGTAVATLDDLSHVYVDFPVPESQLARLAVGQRIDATSVAYAGTSFDGVVSTIDARVDPGTRALTVRGDFANPDHKLRPGMLLEVHLQMPQRQALVLPEIAVVQVGNDSYVYRVKADDTVERADVELGNRDAGDVVVTRGLAAGDRIVVDGTGKLRVGAKISDGNGKPAAPAAGDAPEEG
ncbi:MAG: efflux RND transporter periplasmic adaptor subunit [Luteimonas sp.]|nr:efflux RND transporter periplasmic adaptor subunit [Luteimonas sp.]